MRLRLEFHPSVQFSAQMNKKNRKALFEMSDGIKTVRDLAEAVRIEFDLKAGVEHLHFSVGGFTARHGSYARGVLRDEDVIVLASLKNAGLMPKPVASKSIAASEGQKGKIGHNGNKRTRTGCQAQAPTVKKSKTKQNGGSHIIFDASPRAVSESSSSESEDESSKKSSSSSDCGDDDGGKSSSSSTSSSSESSSEESSSSPSSSSSGDSSSTSDSDSSQSSSMGCSEPDPPATDGVKAAALSAKSSRIPEFDPSWPLLSEDPKIGDILAYKILEVGSEWTCEVTAWRYGCVSHIASPGGIVSLVPWPNASLHPDPMIQNTRAQEEDDEEGYLEPPQSQYDEKGVLHHPLKDFVEVRHVVATDKIAGEQGCPATVQEAGKDIDANVSTPKLSKSQKRRVRAKLKRSQSCPDENGKTEQAISRFGSKSANSDLQYGMRDKDRSGNISTWELCKDALEKKKETLESPQVKNRHCRGSITGLLSYLRAGE